MFFACLALRYFLWPFRHLHNSPVFHQPLRSVGFLEPAFISLSFPRIRLFATRIVSNAVYHLNSPVPPKAAVPRSNSGVQFRDGDRDWHLQFHRVHRSHPWKTNRGAVGILAACGGEDVQPACSDLSVASKGLAPSHSTSPHRAMEGIPLAPFVSHRYKNLRGGHNA